MDNSNLEIEIKLLKKDFDYLKKDADEKNKFLKEELTKINNKLDDDQRIHKEELTKINNKLDDEGRIHRIINKKFDEDMLIFKNKYYNLFYIILVTAVAFSFTIYKTFIK